MDIPEIPDNSLTKEINEIVEIALKLNGIYRFDFYFPATENEISKIEETINYALPEDYKDFLRFSNGMLLNSYTADFLNIDRIINLYHQEKAGWFPADYIIIADIIGDGEVLCIWNKTGKFIRYFDGEETFFDSFKEVLRSIIDYIKEVDEEYLLND